MMHRRIPLLRTSLLSFVMLVPAVAQTPSPLDPEELAFLTLINSYRNANGAGPLSISPALSNSSRWMSGDMASKN